MKGKMERYQAHFLGSKRFSALEFVRREKKKKKNASFFGNVLFGFSFQLNFASLL